MISELVTARHLSRKAVVYIRQSHPHQVLSNQESLRLQYALCQRACDLGWQEADVEIVDADLGLSGAAAVGVEGQLAGRYGVLFDGVIEQRLEQDGALGIGDAPADDPAAEDIKNDVEIEVRSHFLIPLSGWRMLSLNGSRSPIRLIRSTDAAFR